MTMSSTKELFLPLDNLKQNFRSRMRLFDTTSLIESNSPEFDQISDTEERSEEEACCYPILTQQSQMRNKERQYRAVGPRFYQRNNGNSSYPDRRPSKEEPMSKFMAESAKMHEENSNIIKEIRASIDAAIRNQGALIKTLEIQIEQMSKVLQERGFGSLSSSMETNLETKLIRSQLPKLILLRYSV
nr:hypothetical protein [Tanacetum cinerariifolium]